MNQEDRKITIKRIVIFIAIAFVLTYLIELVFVLPAARANKTADSILYTVMAAAAMMMPSIAVLLTRLITKEGFMNHALHFNCNKQTIKYYLLAWFLPAVLIFTGALLYFLIFTGQFDWNMTYYTKTIAKTGTVVSVDALRTTILSQAIAGVILGPVMNVITCFGEEWGWRGYLLPKLMKLIPVIPAILLSGLIWGLWHIPYIVAGLNYGMEYAGYPYLGFLMMVLFCIVIGIFISFITIRTKSCFPAIVAHGAVNATASVGVYFTADGGKLLFGPSITGLVGMIPAIITAVIILALLIRDNACIKESICDTISATDADGESMD